MARGRHATGIQRVICTAQDRGRIIHWAHLRLLKWVRDYPRRAGSWSSKMVGILVTQVRAVEGGPEDGLIPSKVEMTIARPQAAQAVSRLEVM